MTGLLAIGGSAEAYATNSGEVVINEIAWMGTQADYRDEWIELYNTIGQAVDLTGWTLKSTTDGSPNIAFNTTDCNNVFIAPNGYFLLERTDDTTVSDITADCIYTGNLSNSGESLSLEDPSHNVIDTANGNGGSWPAGVNPSGNPTGRATMERIDALASDTDANWATNDGIHRNGLDAKGHPINGTPRTRNSVSAPPPAMGQGDINHDGQINVIDARFCLQIALGFIEANVGQQIACDVNADGQVTLDDARKIAQFAIGQIGSLATRR